MPKYPHMMPNEEPIWDKFLAIYGHQWEAFDYDVRVGRGVDPGPDYEPEWRRLAQLLTQKRIDAVGYRKGEIWIFEVKPYGGLSALGQLLAYEVLYRETYNPKETIKLALVTGRINQDELTAYRAHGIEVFVVGEP